jgi:hypothetical protein
MYIKRSEKVFQRVNYWQAIEVEIQDKPLQRQGFRDIKNAAFPSRKAAFSYWKITLIQQLMINQF